MIDLGGPMTRLQPRLRIFAGCTQDVRGSDRRIASRVSRPVVVKNQRCGYCCEKVDTLVRVFLSRFEIIGDQQARSNQTLCQVCRAVGVTLKGKS